MKKPLAASGFFLFIGLCCRSKVELRERLLSNHANAYTQPLAIIGAIHHWAAVL